MSKLREQFEEEKGEKAVLYHSPALVETGYEAGFRYANPKYVEWLESRTPEKDEEQSEGGLFDKIIEEFDEFVGFDEWWNHLTPEGYSSLKGKVVAIIISTSKGITEEEIEALHSVIIVYFAQYMSYKTHGMIEQSQEYKDTIPHLKSLLAKIPKKKQ